ncbi:glycoside hydrolase superfamily [Gorgonomyces haynaldii]|nr:glycoside hydrolase superfamily [Gorgonomyces haynaldii]
MFNTFLFSAVAALPKCRVTITQSPSSATSALESTLLPSTTSTGVESTLHPTSASTGVEGTLTTAATIASASQTTVETSSTSPKTATKSGATKSMPTGFVYAQGSRMMLNNQQFTFTGVNNYYLFYAQQSDVDQLFADCQQIGASVVRTWLFSDGNRSPGSTAGANGQSIWFQEFVNGQVQFNDDQTTGLGRFDYVIESAKRHGIKLIITMTNNWPDFGGADWYVDRLSASKTHSSFFTDSQAKQAYKNYVQHVLERTNGLSGVQYKNDPTIIAVELINEGRCGGSGNYPQDQSCNTQTLTSWVSEMSQFVKSIDPNHLVAVGDEGFMNGGQHPDGTMSMLNDGTSGMDFEANAKLSSIDILGIHTYMQHWGTDYEPKFTDNTVNWIQSHASVAKQVNKPIYLGEFGVETSRNFDRSSSLERMVQTAKNNGYSGTVVWMLGSQFYGTQYPNNDGFVLNKDSKEVQFIKF